MRPQPLTPAKQKQKPKAANPVADKTVPAVAQAEIPAPTLASEAPPARKYPNLRPWKPGQSGNPAGRAKIEPRVRRHARKYDMEMCRVLAEIAKDPKVAPSERRRAAMDLIAVGSGRPAVVQELLGRPDAPLGPLVNLTFNGQHSSALTPAQAYELMARGTLEPDPTHSAFQAPALEAPKDGQS
jgi:hypothetical protein